jgi:hypothetical protein
MGGGFLTDSRQWVGKLRFFKGCFFRFSFLLGRGSFLSSVARGLWCVQVPPKHRVLYHIIGTYIVGSLEEAPT